MSVTRRDWLKRVSLGAGATLLSPLLTQIARAQVFAMEQIAVFFRFRVGCANHDAGAGNANLAHFIDAAGHWALGRAFEDFHIRIGQHDPDGADFLVALHGIARHEAGRFGQAISLDDLHARRRLQAFAQLQRPGGRAGERILDNTDNTLNHVPPPHTGTAPCREA